MFCSIKNSLTVILYWNYEIIKKEMQDRNILIGRKKAWPMIQ